MIKVRKMIPEDKEAVLEMMRVFYDSPAVFHTSSDSVLERDVEDCLGSSPFVEGFLILISDDDCCAANDKNDINGKNNKEVIAGYGMTAPSYTTEYGGLCVWIEDLYVKPEYRGRGIGSEFLLYIKEEYPEAVRFKLEVEPENERAVEVYKKNGYGVSPYWEMTLEMIEG